MPFRGRGLAAASVLMIVMRAFTVHSLTCHPTEYLINNECCPMCNSGSRVKTDCTEFRTTSCLPCTAGTFMDKPNGLKHCFPCRSCDPGSGLEVKQPCTLRSDTVCGAKEGFFCVEPTGSGCAEAQKHRSCDPGQHISRRGTASTDSECSACSRGTFSDGTSTSCQPHRQCEEENLQLIAAGTPSSDAQCGEKTSNQTGAIVGAVIGSLSLLLLLAALVWLVPYLKKKICQEQDTEESPVSTDSGVSFRDGSPKILVVNPEGKEKENLTVGAQCTDGEKEKEEKENVSQSFLLENRTDPTTHTEESPGVLNCDVNCCQRQNRLNRHFQLSLSSKVKQDGSQPMLSESPEESEEETLSVCSSAASRAV
ncbi:tumor necrosis factor receptor superfamily member 5-like [Menidia menidia]